MIISSIEKMADNRKKNRIIFTVHKLFMSPEPKLI